MSRAVSLPYARPRKCDRDGATTLVNRLPETVTVSVSVVGGAATCARQRRLEVRVNATAHAHNHGSSLSNDFRL